MLKTPVYSDVGGPRNWKHVTDLRKLLLILNYSLEPRDFYIKLLSYFDTDAVIFLL